MFVKSELLDDRAACKEKAVPMVGLVGRYFLPHSVWSCPLVGKTHLHSSSQLLFAFHERLGTPIFSCQHQQIERESSGRHLNRAQMERRFVLPKAEKTYCQ